MTEAYEHRYWVTSEKVARNKHMLLVFDWYLYHFTVFIIGVVSDY